jgi:hypothetical protein
VRLKGLKAAAEMPYMSTIKRQADRSTALHLSNCAGWVWFWCLAGGSNTTEGSGSHHHGSMGLAKATEAAHAWQSLAEREADAAAVAQRDAEAAAAAAEHRLSEADAEVRAGSAAVKEAEKALVAAQQRVHVAMQVRAADCCERDLFWTLCGCLCGGEASRSVCGVCCDRLVIWFCPPRSSSVTTAGASVELLAERALGLSKLLVGRWFVRPCECMAAAASGSAPYADPPRMARGGGAGRLGGRLSRLRRRRTSPSVRRRSTHRSRTPLSAPCARW